MSESNGVIYFPLDVRDLKKGDRISVAEVNRLTSHLHQKYEWRVLWLREKIRKELEKIDVTFTMRTSLIHGLVICTDAEAAMYNHRQTRLGAKRIKRSLGRNLAVDPTQLTADERKAHERNLLRMGRMVSAIQTIQHSHLLPSPKQRETPALTGTG